MTQVADEQEPVVPIDRSSFNSYPFWSPRFWAGMRLGHWLKLLSRNGFRIHPSRLPWALATTCAAPFNTALCGVQQLIYGRRIRQTTPVAPPIFILGHWRTGTTFLQELLSRDPRLTSPSNYQVYATNHFLLTEALVVRYLRFLLPARRPMDNVTLQWDSPQEDEWARITMGLPSPYQRIAFSAETPPYDEYLDMEGLSASELDAWKAGFTWFLQAVTLRTKQRVVFKSPHNTGRLSLLHQMFPDARFLHVTRHPFTFFPSTLRMHRAFDASQSLQTTPEADGLERYVLRTGRRIYDAYLTQRTGIADHQIMDVRFEDLVERPLDTMRLVYERLDLGDVQPALAEFEKHVAPRKNYVRNRHHLPAYWEGEIRREWAQYFESFGYTCDEEG